MRLRPILASLLLLGLALACGGGDTTGTAKPAPPTGSLALRFGTDSFPGYSQAIVSLEKVEATTDGVTWVPLGDIKATYDLMALQGGHGVAILPTTKVTAATYTQFRITWATVNYQMAVQKPAYVVNSYGTEFLLTMPATTVVSGPVTVPAKGSVTAQIMLGGEQAVQSRAGGLFTFQATGQVLDLATTASISGYLTQGSTILAGVEVLAQTVDGNGLGWVQRRAFTNASGAYGLDCLPKGSTYHVVTQPADAVYAYAARVATVDVTAATAYTADLAFGAGQSPGALTITVTPPSTAAQATWAELRQTFYTGGPALIVRSQSMVTGAAQDQAGILGIAPGTYLVTAQRSTGGAAPVRKNGTQFLVTAGSSDSSFISYP